MPELQGSREDLREQMQAQYFSTKSEYSQWSSLEFVGHCTSGNAITISRWRPTTAGDQRRPPLALLAEAILLVIPNEYAATISSLTPPSQAAVKSDNVKRNPDARKFEGCLGIAHRLHLGSARMSESGRANKSVHTRVNFSRSKAAVVRGVGAPSGEQKHTCLKSESVNGLDDMRHCTTGPKNKELSLFKTLVGKSS
ncbi:hypothetical protein C8R45DRAFT_1128054 [Mycena sanguinolenta]|nr:hypothetical protein C8R45DRAFT_1128054 [Mycena sanguinolenta]